jgi:hypothetical protein
VAFALLAAGLAGCGRPAKTPEGRRHADRASRATRSDGAASKQKRPPRPRSGKKSPADRDDADSHVAAIPKDAWAGVFFDAPLTILAEKGPGAPPVGGTSPPASPAVDPPAQTAAEVLPEPSPDDAEEWIVLISGEDLADEAKAIRSSLTDKLRSVGKYSGHYKELRDDAATLAVLAAIAGEHPDPPSWRAWSKYIRDIAAQIARSAVANGDKFYKPTRSAFEKLDSLFSGSKPPDVEDAADKVPFSEIASRISLMHRLERAFNYLKLTVNTGAIFKKESAKVAHEGAMIATLSRVIATPGYDDADLDEYRAFARALQQSGLGVAEAVQNDDFAAYTAALDRGSKACTNCHTEYKNN